MNRKQIWFLAGCLAIGPVIGGASAADVPTDGKSDPRNLTALKDQQVSSPKLMRAKDLIGKSVKNEKGEDIGSIKDIVVDSNQGRIAYAVLQFGGFLGLGEKQFAIPFRALKEDAARSNLILNLPKEKLEAARGFDGDKWPDMANETWARELHKHYGQDAYWEDRDDRVKTPDNRDNRGDNIKGQPQPNATDPKNDPQSKPDAPRTGEPRTGEQREAAARPQLNRTHFWVNRLSEMTGKDVKSKTGEDLGDIKDFMVDMKHGRIVYAIVSDGGTLGINETLTAVPYAALQAQPEQKQFTLDATKDSLKTHSFKESAWPDMADMQWGRRVHEGFKQEPYWTVYGFAGDDLDANWRQDSEYNKAFDAGQSRTISGKVTSISEFSPGKEGAKGRQIVITTDTGDKVTVHLGPVSYLDRKEGALKLKEGDTVTVTGTTGKFEGKDAVRAREIRTSTGQTYPLRDAQGRAKWDRNDDQKTPGDNTKRPDQTPKSPTEERP